MVTSGAPGPQVGHEPEAGTSRTTRFDWRIISIRVLCSIADSLFSFRRLSIRVYNLRRLIDNRAEVAVKSFGNSQIPYQRTLKDV